MFVLFLSCVQPLIVGHLTLGGISRIVNTDSLFSKGGNVRNKSVVSRLYECATYSKLSSLFVYNINNSALLIAYLIYDVDLIFMLPEASAVLILSAFEFYVLLVFVLLLVIGVVFDLNKGGVT